MRHPGLEEPWASESEVRKPAAANGYAPAAPEKPASEPEAKSTPTVSGPKAPAAAPEKAADLGSSPASKPALPASEMSPESSPAEAAAPPTASGPARPEQDGPTQAAPATTDDTAQPAAKNTEPDSGPARQAAGAQEGLAPAPEREAPSHENQAAKPAAASANPADEPEPVKAGGQRPTDPKDADDVMTRRIPGAEAADAAVLAQSRLHTRRSFLGAVAGAAAGYGVYAYLDHAPAKQMQPSPIRNAFNLNAFLNREIFHYHPLAPTYPLHRAETARINGVFGLKKELKLDTWRLQVVGARAASRSPRYVADVTAWNYRYHGETEGLSQNHDNKEAPKPGDAPQGGAPGQDAKVDPNKSSADKMAPAGMVEKAKSDESKAPGGKEQNARHRKPMPDIASSTKMAPASMLQKAMNDEMPDADEDDDDSGEDNNHLGRKPRGREESGESNSTLRAGTPGLLLMLDDITKLPRHEFVTQFKCIEGWSQYIRWAGVRMADFLDVYPPELIDGKEPKYVYMETPDGDYYNGYLLRELRHPQALLVTEMMGAPLEQLHGAPIRLHMPNKYGYKQIKRIGLIAYTNQTPDDYWTKLGYDWYADL